MPKKPTIFHMIWGATVLACSAGRRKPASLPREIAGYAFLQRLSRDEFRPVSVGLYGRKGKRFVIKRWEGRIPDLHYYNLINEVYVSRRMAMLLKAGREELVRVREPVVALKERESFTVVYEYLSGPSLASFPPPAQGAALSAVVECLARLSEGLSPREVRELGWRGLSFYVCMVPVLALLLLFRRPREGARIAGVVRSCLRQAGELRGATLRLAHRDLTPDNVVMAEDGIYLLDCESALLTLPGYDRAFLEVNPGTSQLAASLPQPGGERGSREFLKTYISLHHTLGSGDFFRLNDHYLATLYELHPTAIS